MSDLKIYPSFHGAQIPKQIKKIPQHYIKIEPTVEEYPFPKIWKLADKLILKKIDKLKKTPLSKEPYCRALETNLEKQNINVRFKDNIKLAKYIKNGIEMLQSNNIPVPRNIIFISSLINLIGYKGLTYWLNNHKEESPIILPKNTANKTDSIKRLYKRGFISTQNPLHVFLHEVGHWLHFQNGFDFNKNAEIWTKINIKQIKKEVSKQAIQKDDGSEFYPEFFAGSISGHKYSPEIKKLAEELSHN